MGLDTRAKGLTEENGYHCGYIKYYYFLQEIIKVAYKDDRMLRIFIKGANDADDIAYWNEHCNEDLDILLFHSDCDGKFTYKDCKKIYNAIKDLKSDMQGHNYSTNLVKYNMFDQWKGIFKHCAENRVTLYYE